MQCTCLNLHIKHSKIIFEHIQVFSQIVIEKLRQFIINVNLEKQ